MATVTADPGGPRGGGLVGLLLLPAAGAALGYRQARAAQTDDRLHPR